MYNYLCVYNVCYGAWKIRRVRTHFAVIDDCYQYTSKFMDMKSGLFYNITFIKKIKRIHKLIDDATKKEDTPLLRDK